MALVPFFRWPIILTTWSTDWAQKHIVCYILKAMCVFSPFINATMKSRKKKGRAPSGLIYTVHSCNVFAMSFYVLGLNLSWFYFFSCNTFSWFSSFLYIYLSRQGWWRSDSLTPLCGPVGNATLCSAAFFFFLFGRHFDTHEKVSTPAILERCILEWNQYTLAIYFSVLRSQSKRVSLTGVNDWIQLGNGAKFETKGNR